MKKGNKLRRMILYNPFINNLIVINVYFSGGDAIDIEPILGFRYGLNLYLIGWL